MPPFLVTLFDRLLLLGGILVIGLVAGYFYRYQHDAVRFSALAQAANDQAQQSKLTEAQYVNNANTINGAWYGYLRNTCASVHGVLDLKNGRCTLPKRDSTAQPGPYQPEYGTVCTRQYWLNGQLDAETVNLWHETAIRNNWKFQ